MSINIFEINIFASIDALLNVIDYVQIARSSEQTLRIDDTCYWQTIDAFSHNGRNIIQTRTIFIDKFQRYSELCRFW